MVNLIYIFGYIKNKKKLHERSSLVSKYNDCNSYYWCCLGSLLHIYLWSKIYFL